MSSVNHEFGKSAAASPEAKATTSMPSDRVRRTPAPQDSWSLVHPRRRDSANSAANSGFAVPFGQMLSYGSNGSPTITITKTLFSAGEVTSTTSSQCANPSSTQGMTATLDSPEVSAFIGATQANVAAVGGTTTSITTGTSTISNIQTSTRTTQSTKSLSSLLISSNTPTSSNPSTSTTGTFTTNTSSTASPSSTSGSQSSPAPAGQPGKIAGSVIGSIAAFGIIGFLIWYFCVKKRGKIKSTTAVKLWRRKSFDVKTPQLEGQSLEQTRTIMLQQAELNKSKENEIDSFLGTSGNESQHKGVPATRITSPIQSPAPRPSWIAIAMSSASPPHAPPMPRSNSQNPTKTAASTGRSPQHPAPLMRGFGHQQKGLVPPPLGPGNKPAPIITSPQLGRYENVSPLSPRVLFKSVSNTTGKAWRRASQALSPSSYQRLNPDSQGRVERPKMERRGPGTRNPELEIGAQTDNGWNSQWI